MTKKRKILVVDDDRAIADILASLLKKNGFDVYVAYSGTRAVELALQIEPDLLVSDVMMPDKNGIEVAATIREKLPQCKVVLCSGSARAIELLSVARQYGYEGDILAKPLHPRDLLLRLEGQSA